MKTSPDCDHDFEILVINCDQSTIGFYGTLYTYSPYPYHSPHIVKCYSNYSLSRHLEGNITTPWRTDWHPTKGTTSCLMLSQHHCSDYMKGSLSIYTPELQSCGLVTSRGAPQALLLLVVYSKHVNRWPK